ncbi:MAG: hypothetical protein ACE5GD_04495 [Candidatus Geothermarchaeales archaeon]
MGYEMSIAVVDERGRVAIPKMIREKYRPNRVLFVDVGSHIVLIVLPEDPVASLNGISGDISQSVREMKEEAGRLALGR